ENGLAPRWLRRVHDFLETSFRENLSLNEIAGVGDVHPVHLAREYRRYFGCSIGEFLRRKRIEQACQLLARSNAPISEIALACGFSDQSHFSSAFKRQAGVTPGKFRQLA
ncbi:MAG TPA: AraC family transcriptional regulator, partial [Bryobacteraceae bacterium]|nr:AraC family transcriptional regulator [Bryobacteraceae bacterium]